MYKLEKYLLDAFGMRIRLLPLNKNDVNRLPVYMRSYDLKTCEINNRKIITITLDDYTEFTVEKLRKQADLIEKLIGLPVVFVLENLEAYNRKRLVEKKIAFIVPGKQIYIPFLLLDFREVKTQKEEEKEKFSPATQCVLLYYLLGNEIKGLNFKELAKKLKYGQMTMTRAANSLEDYNLCKIEGLKNKTLLFERDKKQIWNEALPYLINPVEKEFHQEEIEISNEYYVGGINALSNYTNIAGESKSVFAVYKKVFEDLKQKRKNNPADKIKNITIQLWKYDPSILTRNKYVDPLSLYLSLKEIEDERVSKELKILLGELWSKG